MEEYTILCIDPYRKIYKHSSTRIILRGARGICFTVWRFEFDVLVIASLWPSGFMRAVSPLVMFPGLLPQAVTPGMLPKLLPGPLHLSRMLIKATLYVVYGFAFLVFRHPSAWGC